MNNSYILTLEDNPHPNDTNFIRERLAEYNHRQVGSDNHKALTIFLKNEANTIRGGIIGDTYWGWLYVEILWLAKTLRQRGYGRALLAAAEQQALKRGCRYAHLDTMSFQALSFYEKQGYVVFGKLQDLPIGHSRYFLKKAL